MKKIIAALLIVAATTSPASAITSAQRVQLLKYQRCMQQAKSQAQFKPADFCHDEFEGTRDQHGGHGKRSSTERRIGDGDGVSRRLPAVFEQCVDRSQKQDSQWNGERFCRDDGMSG